MLTTDENVGEGVIGRRLVFCPRLEAMSMDKLIRSCDDCKDFFVYCCNCSQRFNNDGYRDSGRLCHHFRMIFTDGACRLNGQAGATAGLGVAFGEREEAQMSVPVTTVWDPDQKRTSQRAELLAAQAGLWWLIEADRLNNGEPDGKPKEKARKGRKGRDPNDQDDTKNWIIATDSEYVVKGITEWLPAWKVSRPGEALCLAISYLLSIVPLLISVE